jgi:hypothetical protein
MFGPKILVSGKSPNMSLSTDVVRITLMPVAGHLQALDQEERESIAQEFQSRFLGYFLRNVTKVRIPDFDVSELTLPVQEIAQALGAAVVGDTGMQAKIVPLLKAQDEEIRADRASAFDSIVIEAILFFIHQGCTKVRMSALATEVTAIYKGRGVNEEASAEKVGWAVRHLTIPSGRIDRAGNGVALPRVTCDLVHQLAQAHGVQTIASNLRPDCAYCRELEPKK